MATFSKLGLKSIASFSKNICHKYCRIVSMQKNKICTSISGDQDGKELVQWHDTATLYVHWPYCQKRCTYCNFNKYISKHVDHERMKNCLVAEASYLLSLSNIRKINSVFFGGGTPSLAEASTIKSVIDVVKDKVEFDPQSEVTIEVNPTDIETEKLSSFKDAGVNRVSLGLQALNDDDLKLFGRNHSAEEGLRSLEVCKQLFPGRTSIDVIFGRPHQTINMWNEELDKIMILADDHISLYQLTLERGTALFKMVMDREIMMPNTDRMADFYDLAVQKLEDNGYIRYEVSNFAKTEIAESSHNKSYWNGSQYIGIGPGAHGRFVPKKENKLKRESRIQTLEPIPWMYEVGKYGHATRKAVSQTQEDMLQEIIMLGLRTKLGITQARWSDFYPETALYDIFSDTYTVKMFIAEGFLILDERGMSSTPRGMNVVDSIIPELLIILNNHLSLHS